METQDKRMEEYIHPEGRIVKADMDKITIYGLYFVSFIILTLLFCYIWGFNESHNSHYELGDTKNYEVWTPLWFSSLFITPIVCFFIQFILLYLFSGRNIHCLGMSWLSWRVLVRKKLPLKYYRIALLFPYFFIGLLLIIHGFGIGDGLTYQIGTYCILIGLPDLDYYWTLRSFKAEDKIVDGKKPYSCMILKSTY